MLGPQKPCEKIDIPGSPPLDSRNARAFGDRISDDIGIRIGAKLCKQKEAIFHSVRFTGVACA
jgi:hypothetical protein